MTDQKDYSPLHVEPARAAFAAWVMHLRAGSSFYQTGTGAVEKDRNNQNITVIREMARPHWRGGVDNASADGLFPSNGIVNESLKKVCELQNHISVMIEPVRTVSAAWVMHPRAGFFLKSHISESTNLNTTLFQELARPHRSGSAGDAFAGGLYSLKRQTTRYQKKTLPPFRKKPVRTGDASLAMLSRTGFFLFSQPAAA
jgi:hypothetical protein